jgi:DNA adenine methylase
VTAPSRPLLRYLGSKWRLAPWLLDHLPPHEIYVEAFGGGAALLLRKPRARTEVYNDVDQQLVNLFRILRTADTAADFIRQVKLTPYARDEYFEAHEPTDDAMESARRLLIRSHMGHGSRGTSSPTPSGFRQDGTTGSTRVAGEWGDLPEALQAIVERLRGVTIDNRPATDVLTYWDAPNVLHYLDPPYMPETRSARARQPAGYHAYTHELTVEDHEALLAQARASRAMVAISGYSSPLYDDALSDWERLTTVTRAHRNQPRTEVLWLNPAAAAARAQRSLWEAAA